MDSKNKFLCFTRFYERCITRLPRQQAVLRDVKRHCSQSRASYDQSDVTSVFWQNLTCSCFSVYGIFAMSFCCISNHFVFSVFNVLFSLFFSAIRNKVRERIKRKEYNFLKRLVVCRHINSLRMKQWILFEQFIAGTDPLKVGGGRANAPSIAR